MRAGAIWLAWGPECRTRCGIQGHGGTIVKQFRRAVRCLVSIEPMSTMARIRGTFPGIVAALIAALPVAGHASDFLLMPANFRMYELTAGGVSELVPEWTQRARDNLLDAVSLNAAEREGANVIQLPELDDDERAIVEEHVALFEANVYSAVQMVLGSGLDKNYDDFEFTVGPGLGFLGERYGAEKALLVSGQQSKSSGGRKAMMVFAAATGVAVISASSGVLVGEIDLASGDVTWINYAVPITSGDMRSRSDAERTVRQLMAPYPGGRLTGGK